MKIVYWISFALIVLTLAPSTLYWVLYLSTGEALARTRAKNFFHWTKVVVLATFNIWVFTRVFNAIVDTFFSSPKPPLPPVT